MQLSAWSVHAGSHACTLSKKNTVLVVLNYSHNCIHKYKARSAIRKIISKCTFQVSHPSQQQERAAADNSRASMDAHDLHLHGPPAHWMEPPWIPRQETT
jgi:6-phosphogluconolactonase (cycloisomerase 2 family)